MCIRDRTKVIISIFAGRAGDTGKDPVPEFKKSITMAKKFKNVEILWASVREPYNYLQAKQLGCHIITIPPSTIEKIENFASNKKNITHHEIIKLTNLADNYSASELIDHSLAKNTRKTVTILNENNYSDEDNIIVIRTLLAKLKRLLKICELVDGKNNIDQAISSFKPPIFWKDKPLVTQQIKSWKKEELRNLIYESNKIELLIKKNSSIAKNILSDFIINNSKKISN